MKIFDRVFFVVINKQLDSEGIRTFFNTWDRTFSIQNKLIKFISKLNSYMHESGKIQSEVCNNNYEQTGSKLFVFYFHTWKMIEIVQ